MRGLGYRGEARLPARWPMVSGGLLGAVVVMAALLALPGGVSAEPSCTDIWTGGASDGLWQSAGNWSTASVPVSSDVACIGSGTTVKVTAGSAVTGSLEDQGSLVLSGGSLELTDAVTMSNVDSLTLEGGTLTGAGSITVSGSFSLVVPDSTMSGSRRDGSRIWGVRGHRSFIGLRTDVF